VVSIVVKASTKAGEFFCFHCGKRVADRAERCQSCGAIFSKTTDAFRCPKCSKLLPIGTAICPSCNLRFKIRAVSSSSKMTEDDRFLMKLIDWGKEKSDTARQTRAKKRGQRATPAIAPAAPKGVLHEKSDTVKRIESPQPPLNSGTGSIEVREIPDTLGRRDETKKGLRAVSSQRARPLKQLRSYLENEAMVAGGELPDEIERLFEQLDSELNQIIKLKDEIMQLRSSIQKADISKRNESLDSSTTYREPEESHGLSKQALKKRLEVREKEVETLKRHQEEIDQREELLNRKIRGYAVKKKELEKVEKELDARKKADELKASAIGVESGREAAGKMVSGDAREEWSREQSKIRMGLLEIRNELSPGENSMSYYPSQISGETMERIEVLEEKLVDVKKERDDLAQKMQEMEAVMHDVVTLLKVLDQLLGRLPPAMISEFSKSKDFSLYERVLDKLNI